jgi:hypothetical protein
MLVTDGHLNNKYLVFPYQNILSNNNSAEACLNLCAAYGYPAAGMEYSDECCEFSANNLLCLFPLHPIGQIACMLTNPYDHAYVMAL